MRYLGTLLIALVFFTKQGTAQGAENIVQWTVQVVESNAPNTTKIVAKARVAEGWHIFGQKPGDEFLIPTRFSFEDKSIEVVSIKEVGTLQKEEIPEVGKVQYYEKEVSFEIVIRSIKDEIKGFVEFQVCNASMCLPPTEVAFSTTIN